MNVDIRQPYEDNIWWEDRDFHCIDTSGVHHICKNALFSGLRYKFVDYDSTENVTLVGNSKNEPQE